MMFDKFFLLAALIFPTILMVGNWSAAIAQQSDRYLSDKEIQALEAEFKKVSRGGGGRLYKDARQASEVNEVNQFVNAWKKAEPSIAPFLGDWGGFEESLLIYPSTTQGKACVIHKFYGTNGFQYSFNFGQVVGNKLISDGESGKTIVLRKMAPVRSGDKAVFLARFQSSRSREIVSAYVFPKKLTEIRDSRFMKLGCTVSLPSANMAGVIEENGRKLQDLPDGQYVYREITTPKRLDNSRYFIFRKIGISTIGFNFQPHTDGQACFRGVLQDNSIINIVNGETIYGRDRRVDREVLPKYEFRRANDENLSYFYKDSLERVSKIYPKSVANFQECISLFSPINPVVSTPVKPTNTIARYPTNDDFNALENKLQGNPESLVKLRGNQAAKRRKFQNDWKVRNPAAAKFLGTWYTGDRYFYVFPSTAKGGTCVVTQDANGKLDMKIGVVLNKELRYGGGKGFFWVNRENIIASRDSGSGSLYPIYATFAMPELSENMIGDMERQKCITSLPFQ